MFRGRSLSTARVKNFSTAKQAFFEIKTCTYARGLRRTSLRVHQQNRATRCLDLNLGGEMSCCRILKEQTLRVGDSNFRCCYLSCLGTLRDKWPCERDLKMCSLNAGHYQSSSLLCYQVAAACHWSAVAPFGGSCVPGLTCSKYACMYVLIIFRIFTNAQMHMRCTHKKGAHILGGATCCDVAERLLLDSAGHGLILEYSDTWVYTPDLAHDREETKCFRKVPARILMPLLVRPLP